MSLEKAYNGHVITEAFFEGKFGVIDPIYGYFFYEDEPLDAYTLMIKSDYLKDYNMEYRELFRKIAISEYDPQDTDNDYSISSVNDYYRLYCATYV